MDEPKKSNKAIVAVIVVVLLVAATTAVVALNNQPASTESSSDTATTTPPTTSESGTNNATASTGNYKDGTYSATGSYSTPGGTESITLSVTLKGNVITDSTLTQHADSGESEEYQDRFASGYKSYVTGKNVNEVSLSRVAGSSLTSDGFDAALETIKNDAKA